MGLVDWLLLSVGTCFIAVYLVYVPVDIQRHARYWKVPFKWAAARFAYLFHFVFFLGTLLITPVFVIGLTLLPVWTTWTASLIGASILLVVAIIANRYAYKYTKQVLIWKKDPKVERNPFTRIMFRRVGIDNWYRIITPIWVAFYIGVVAYAYLVIGYSPFAIYFISGPFWLLSMDFINDFVAIRSASYLMTKTTDSIAFRGVLPGLYKGPESLGRILWKGPSAWNIGSGKEETQVS